jgi:superfamily II DNA or RNA helicase
VPVTADKRVEADLAQVEATVGGRAFKRGRAYARGNRVLALDFDEQTSTLTGAVLGQGALYETAAFFDAEAAEPPELVDGECTCPVGYNCKHVAALVIAAAGGGSPGAGIGARTSARPAARRARSGRRHTGGAMPPRPPAWERSLRALIGGEARSEQRTGTPLAIELALRRATGAGQGSWRLLARLMRPGARGGWINGQLSWSGLDHWQVTGAGYRPEHLALVRELRAIYSARERRAGYYYGYGSEKTLDLCDCESPQLWPLLDEARRVGVALVHEHPHLGEVSMQGRGEVVLDLTRRQGGRYGHAAEGSLVSATLRIDGEPAAGLEPVLFLGASAHGVLCAESADTRASASGERPEQRRLRLVRLERPAGHALQRMLLEGERLELPAGELGRFAQELYPALRRVAPVVSSDESFAAPQISPPELVLRATYGARHTVQVAWEWAYRIGESTHRAPLDGGPEGGHRDGPRDGEGLEGAHFRDPGAERELLARTDLTGTGLERFALLDVAGAPAAPHALTLSGMDCMDFTTGVLPGLSATPGLSVAVVGEPADYRDVGETLAIGLCTSEIAGERDWFDLGVTISVEGRELPFAEVFSALAGGASHVLLPDGAHFSLQDPRLQELRRLIEEARALGDAPSGELRISRYQAGLWSELTALGVVREQAQAWQRQVDALAGIGELSDHEPPGAVRAELRPYQREGFAWLASLWELELGGILADDMGLGKTLQTLAMICHTRARHAGVGPFLIVVPTSVVSGWAGEAARFTPELRVEAVMETLAKSGRTIEQLAQADAVVTTYTLLRLDAAAYASVSWAGVVLDEAQYVKNHQARTYRCVRELQAPFRLALSGTPLENNLMELWSLLSITAPGLFPDPRRFAESYARPIERAGDAEQLARLRRRIKPLIKRRTKELVAAELPAKQEQAIEVELHRRHRKLYDTYLQRERQKVLGLIDDFDRNRFTILRSITLMRQLSLHPGLVDERHAAVPCAKLAALCEQLEEVVGGGHRALVFSQFTGFLAKVRQQLDGQGIAYSYLDGRTRARARVIEGFKQGSDAVFLISLKAGGLGLNLTEADYCFLLDPWWNPATEAQAVDRAHRIGQARQVMVYRMIARNTIEEKVAALARRKAALFRGVMDDGDLFASRLTAEDIRGLLG